MPANRKGLLLNLEHEDEAWMGRGAVCKNFQLLTPVSNPPVTAVPLPAR